MRIRNLCAGIGIALTTLGAGVASLRFDSALGKSTDAAAPRRKTRRRR